MPGRSIDRVPTDSAKKVTNSVKIQAEFQNQSFPVEMFSSSRTWVNPKVKQDTKRQQLNAARRRTCPNSPFWHPDFDLAKHNQEWEAGRLRREEQKEAQDLGVAEQSRMLQETPSTTAPHMRAPFDGKDFDTNHSNVLSWETIFCPQWEKGKVNIAPWPSKSEMKYEGEDRISTDKLHRRFLGTPRVDGNETVTWSHKNIIGQFEFDDFLFPGGGRNPTEVEVFMRTHTIAELEFSDEEGQEALGKDLMDHLDPQDQW